MKGIIIIVNYKSDEYSIQFIKRYIELFNDQVDLIVVDNSNSIILKNYLDRINSSVQYYATKSNLGYFGAAKCVLNKIDYQSRDYIIISNNDVHIINNDFFINLENTLKKADVLAPSIINSSGKQQNPHRLKKISKINVLFWYFFFFNFHIAKILLFLRCKVRRSDRINNFQLRERMIFSPHGAFVIFARSFFNKGGFIDDGFFLYGEEDSIGFQCHRSDMKVLFNPELKVLHMESRSIGKDFTKSKFDFQKKAFKYIMQEYYWQYVVYFSGFIDLVWF